jgi:predicted nucleic acid-binding protein
MEVKKKFRKDGIELDDARQNVSREKSRGKNILATRQDFRGAGVSQAV